MCGIGECIYENTGLSLQEQHISAVRAFFVDAPAYVDGIYSVPATDRCKRIVEKQRESRDRIERMSGRRSFWLPNESHDYLCYVKQRYRRKKIVKPRGSLENT